MNLHEKLLEIRKSCPYLKKDNSGYEYQYVSSSQTLGTLRGKMDELGVLLIPSIESFEIRDHTTSKGGHNYLTILDMLYAWVDASNPEDNIVCKWTGQGLDSGEKGVGKALTYSEKYFLLKFFNVATDKDDPDRFQQKYDQSEDKEPELIKDPKPDRVKPKPTYTSKPMSDLQNKKLYAMSKAGGASTTEVDEFKAFLKALAEVETMEVEGKQKITMSGASYIFDHFAQLKADFNAFKKVTEVFSTDDDPDAIPY